MSVVVLTHLLLKKPFFSSCIAEKTTTETFLKKPEETILSILAVILTVLALYKANSGGPVWANPFGTRILPNVLRLVTTSAIAVWFVIWLAVASLIIVTIKVVLEKKRKNHLVQRLLWYKNFRYFKVIVAWCNRNCICILTAYNYYVSVQPGLPFLANDVQ